MQDRSEITLNWNFGFQELSDTTWNELDFELSFSTLSSERLVREPSENKPSKLLSNNDKYSRDLRLPRANGMVPVNWFDERSRTRSLVKLVKHKGKFPTSLFLLKSSSSKFFNSQIPMITKIQNILFTLFKKKNFIRQHKIIRILTNLPCKSVEAENLLPRRSRAFSCFRGVISVTKPHKSTFKYKFKHVVT